MRGATMKSLSGYIGVAVFLLLAGGPTFGFGGTSPGFEKLNPSNCFKLDDKSRTKLPESWRKYAASTKACPLKPKSANEAKASIVTVWVDDYYTGRSPDAAWENFPKPLIVDQDLNKIGELPELYPVDEPREIDVFIGKWQLGRPREIRVDVYNPAVSGDYFYPPIRYSEKTGKYEMKKGEVTYGRRR
jgi:hypothetical protein